MVEARRAREVRAEWTHILGRTYKRDDRGRFGSGGGGSDEDAEPLYEGADALASVSIAQSTLESAEWNDQNRAELNEAGLSDDDITAANEAIAAYQTGGEFESINSGLETGDIDPETRARAEAIQRAAEASPLLADVVVWRGVRERRELSEGDIWTRGGFSSTSSDETYARQFAFETPTSATRGGDYQPTLYRIRAPRGTPALRLDGQGEDEVLLGAGLGFRVTADHGIVDGARRVDLEVVT